jgi:uncharacterized protein
VKIVFDTNVLLAGIFSRGLCEALLDACLGSECTVVLSEYILREFADHARNKFGAPAMEIREAIEFLRNHTEIVEPEKVPAGACRDEDDLPILGTALAGKADCLVTGDKDLLDLRECQGISIISPRTLYSQIER